MAKPMEQSEIEQQAARLVSREQDLDQQQAHFEQAELQWQLERQEYQQEIRQLLARLRDARPTAA